MAKKVASPAVSTPKATVADAPQAQAAPARGLGALLKKTAVQDKPKKSGPVEIKIDAPEIKDKITAYVFESAKKKSAENRMKNIGEDLRPVFESEAIAKSRSDKMFHRTVSINGDMNWGFGQLKVASPDEKKGTTAESIDAALLAKLGQEKYDRWIGPTWEIFVKPEQVTEATIVLLKEKLGEEVFDQIFASKQTNALKEVGAGDDAIVLMRKEAALDEKDAVLVGELIEANLIVKWNGPITPQKGALAEQEQLLLKQAMEASAKPSVTVNVQAAKGA